MGQRQMSSPSVFNFFLPDYVATGEMADADLAGPEFQILTATTAMSTQNIYGNALMWGFGLWDEERPGDQMSFGGRPPGFGRSRWCNRPFGSSFDLWPTKGRYASNPRRRLQWPSRLVRHKANGCDARTHHCTFT